MRAAELGMSRPRGTIQARMSSLNLAAAEEWEEGGEHQAELLKILYWLEELLQAPEHTAGANGSQQYLQGLARPHL